MLREGRLSSGRQWILEESRKSAVGAGSHLMLHFEGDPDMNSVELEDKRELLGLALEIASEVALEQERFRIAVNGAGEAKRPHFHIHIILPAGDDALPRLVDRVQG